MGRIGIELRGRNIPARRQHYEIALFDCLGVPFWFIPRFFVLVIVLSVSGTRTRRYRIEYEYEYHFIEYEYDRRQNSATSRIATRFESNQPSLTLSRLIDSQVAWETDPLQLHYFPTGTVAQWLEQGTQAICMGAGKHRINVTAMDLAANARVPRFHLTLRDSRSSST
jgi:hypothetical protein